MQNFNIIKKSEIKQTYRVSKIMNDFDVKLENSNEKFKGEIELPKEWQIGVIVGSSGTGKTTIANELFSEYMNFNFKYTHKSVIDDMPNIDIKEIEKMFYAVGFGSVPSWLKPYNVLSNGEKMRVELARQLLTSDYVVFDEFTSVVDRQVAKAMCIALRKVMNKYDDKKFVAISCHKDILDWIEPDWVFNTDNMHQVFQSARESKQNSKLKNVAGMSGLSLGNIII